MFDVCHARYCQLRDWLSGRIPASAGRDTPSGGYRWKPDRVGAEEYAADFELAARRALARPTWKKRMRLFEIYFLDGTEYKHAIALVGVPVSTFDWWCWEIKKAVGREFARRGVFPPGRYFKGR